MISKSTNSPQDKETWGEQNLASVIINVYRLCFLVAGKTLRKTYGN